MVLIFFIRSTAFLGISIAQKREGVNPFRAEHDKSPLGGWRGGRKTARSFRGSGRGVGDGIVSTI